MEVELTYIEIIKTEDKEVVVVGAEATPENIAAFKDIFGEKVSITKV